MASFLSVKSVLGFVHRGAVEETGRKAVGEGTGPPGGLAVCVCAILPMAFHDGNSPWFQSPLSLHA